MYRHILVPIDCSHEARQAMMQVIHYFANQHIVKITLAATVTPAPDSQIQAKRIAHAEEALDAAGKILGQYGVYTRRIVVQGDDPSAALADVSRDPRALYDMIVMGAYQARLEDFEMPCQGSLVDRLSQKVSIPVMVLPAGG
jgi:nucleotide-binding universal stress UspA family protein